MHSIWRGDDTQLVAFIDASLIGPSVTTVRSLVNDVFWCSGGVGCYQGICLCVDYGGNRLRACLPHSAAKAGSTQLNSRAVGHRGKLVQL